MHADNGGEPSSQDIDFPLMGTTFTRLWHPRARRFFRSREREPGE